MVEGTGETGEARRRHKRSRHQQREAGPSTSQPVVAPAPSELPGGAPFISPPAAHHVEPGELPFEAYHSIAAMSGAPNEAGYAGHHAGTSGMPGEQEIEVTSRLDQEAIDAAHAAGRGRFRRGVVNPQRSERRVLHNEERLRLRGLEPRFPELPPPVEGAIDLREGRWAHGEEFTVRPGVLDMDSINMPGVGARLLYSTILPRDEDRYFRNPPDDMDDFERHLAIVSFPPPSSLFFFDSSLKVTCLISFVAGRTGGCGNKCK